MNNVLLLFLPLALILAYPIYSVLTNRNKARSEFKKIIDTGFQPKILFDMSDSIIAVDSSARHIAFVNVGVFVHPRSKNPPIDRDSFTYHTTGVVPLSLIDAISVNYDDSPQVLNARVTVNLNAPNCFNTGGEINFHVSPNGLKQVEELSKQLPLVIQTERMNREA
jgi:hypothetical protein